MPLLAMGLSVSPFVAWYEQHGTSLTHLTDPAVLPATSADGGAAWTSDGVYLAVATHSGVDLYKRSGGSLTHLSSHGTWDSFDVQWSPDGNYLAVAHDVSPCIAVFSRSGDTLTQIADPSPAVGNLGAGVAWTPNGTYLALAYTLGLQWYDFSSHTLSVLTSPGTVPPSGVGCDWSPDNTYLAMAHGSPSPPYFSWYSRSGTTLTKLTDPATMPPFAADDCKWSPDGNYLAVAHQSSPYLTVYSRSGTTLTKIADPATLPTGNSDSLAWSLDGTMLAVGAFTTSPYLCLYSFSSGTLTRLTDPPQPAGRPTGAMEFVIGSISSGWSVGSIKIGG